MESQDEVAQIVAAWKLKRPDLDSSPVFALSRVSRLACHLNLERHRAFASHGLEPWEFDVLSFLRRSDASYTLTPGTLVGELLVSSGVMTNRIDRLELKGLVSHSPSPEDRCVVLMSLSGKGRARVDSTLATLLEREHTILSPLNTEARRRFTTQLMGILTPFDRAHSCTWYQGSCLTPVV